MARGDTPAPQLLAELDAYQAQVRELLAGHGDAPALSVRPSDDAWSVHEHLRHLLYAEQLHLRVLLPPSQPFSSLPLPPALVAMRGAGFRKVGSEDTPIPELLAAWEVIHAHTHSHTRASVREDSPGTRAALERNLRHLRSHTGQVERLLRAPRR